MMVLPTVRSAGRVGPFLLITLLSLTGPAVGSEAQTVESVPGDADPACVTSDSRVPAAAATATLTCPQRGPCDGHICVYAGLRQLSHEACASG